jgi:signal transduction histidine kinase
VRALVVQDWPSHAEHLRLIVETQADDLRQALTAAGFEVDIALDADAAVSQFIRSKYDVAIVDVSMPGLSGYEVCRTLKSTPSGARTPAILMVAPIDPMHVVRALHCGADLLIAKPHALEQLISRVRTLVQKQGDKARGERAVSADRADLEAHEVAANAGNERVFDFLLASFEDLVRAHRELSECRSELANAQQAAQSFAHELERRVRERTCELMERRELQHQAEKMEILGDVAGGIAHDFNNVLTVVVGSLDTISGEIKGNPRIKKLSDTALEAAMRGADLTRQLLAFSRKQPLAPRLSNVNDVVASMTQMLTRLLGEKVEIEMDTDDDLWPVVVDPAQFQAAISNLSRNAREAMPNGGKLRFQTRNVVLDGGYAANNLGVTPGDYCLISLSDTGSGMPPKILARVFEPLFTTKPGGQTAGLGLSTVFGFVKQSGGHVKIESQEGRGTTVRLYLPRARPEQLVEGSRARKLSPHPPSGDETILIVEDDAQVRQTVVQQVRALGYRVIEADRAGPALAALDRHADIDLLFTDMILPGGIGGRELAHEARVVKPDLSVLFTSGYLRGLRADHRLDPGDVFIGKPYRLRDLAEKIREALGQQEQQRNAARG